VAGREVTGRDGDGWRALPGTPVTGADVAIGIDVGGGSIKLGLVTRAGAIIARRRLDHRHGAAGEAIVAGCAEAAAALLSDRPGGRLCGIGVGFPGHLAADRGSGSMGNVPALDGLPVAALLGRRFGCPVRLINDADAALMAEYRFGAGRGVRRLLLVALGTGIGVGFALDGVPVETAGGCLGDAGHMIVVRHGARRCRQGCLGCLESVASGAAIEAQAGATRAPEGAGGATALLIGDALAGDPAAAAILTDAGRWIGMAAASWCNLFAPDRVLIGGGLSAAGALILDAVRDEALGRAMPGNVAGTDFALAGLGNDAGIVGAAAGLLFADAPGQGGGAATRDERGHA